MCIWWICSILFVMRNLISSHHKNNVKTGSQCSLLVSASSEHAWFESGPYCVDLQCSPCVCVSVCLKLSSLMHSRIGIYKNCVCPLSSVAGLIIYDMPRVDATFHIESYRRWMDSNHRLTCRIHESIHPSSIWLHSSAGANPSRTWNDNIQRLQKTESFRKLKKVNNICISRPNVSGFWEKTSWMNPV